MLNEFIEFEEYSFSKRKTNRLSIINMKEINKTKFKKKMSFDNYSFNGIYRPLHIIAKKYNNDNPKKTIDALKAWLGYKDIKIDKCIDSWFLKYLKNNNEDGLLLNHKSRIDKHYYENEDDEGKYSRINLRIIKSEVVDDNGLENRVLVSDIKTEELKELISTKGGKTINHKTFDYLLKLTAYYLLQQLDNPTSSYNEDDYSSRVNIKKVDFSNWCGIPDYKCGERPFNNFKSLIINKNRLLIIDRGNGNESPKLRFLNEWIDNFKLIDNKDLKKYITKHKGSYFIDDGVNQLLKYDID